MAVAKPLHVESAHEGDRARLTIAGELDVATVPRLQEAIDAALDVRPAQLVVDMRGLGFVDSSGLRLFIVLADRAREAGWELMLVRPEAAVLAVFQITRAEENLPFVDGPPA